MHINFLTRPFCQVERSMAHAKSDTICTKNQKPTCLLISILLGNAIWLLIITWWPLSLSNFIVECFLILTWNLFELKSYAKGLNTQKLLLTLSGGMKQLVILNIISDFYKCFSDISLDKWSVDHEEGWKLFVKFF